MQFESKNRFSFLGINAQSAIKYFFGGNASIAIFILFLICFFLIREAWLFFPSHHKELKVYRASGVEYFTAVEEPYQRYKVRSNGLLRAFQYEYNHPALKEQEAMAAYEATALEVKHELGTDYDLYNEISERLEDLAPESEKAVKLTKAKNDLEKLINDKKVSLADSGSFLFPGKLSTWNIPELSDVSQEERRQIIEQILALPIGSRDETAFYTSRDEAADALLDANWERSKPISDLNIAWKKHARDYDKIWKQLQGQTVGVKERYNSAASVSTRFNAQMTVAMAQKKDETVAFKMVPAVEVIAEAETLNPYARAFYIDFLSKELDRLSPDRQLKPLRGISDEAEDRLKQERKDILSAYPGFFELLSEPSPQFAVIDDEKAALPEDMADELTRLASIEALGKPKYLELTEALPRLKGEFPFAEEAAILNESTPQLIAAVQKIEEGTREILEALPKDSELQSPLAREELATYREEVVQSMEEFRQMSSDLTAWKHDNEWTWGETLGAFFLGSKWTNNSAIQDRYGILPMLTGSLIIATVALLISTPIALSAAVYVNQLSSRKEQNFLKPAIEFIEAIPSVVLGFIGIAVVGDMLKEVSEWPLLSWLPGFPIEARLNMLNAALLLAFMSIPIIFSLAEDALNNVPTAYRDASFALGADKVQTAFRVILPSSLSGVMAAVLLGFGRVIGETMVVLLIAGNRIALPDFSKGIGVVTEPSHTMTGIIAQGLGEAGIGSTTYRALFMVGVVLFTITLVINFFGQRILNRFQSKH